MIKRGEESRENILQYIKEYISEHGYAPSRREICNGVGLKSTASVQRHLEKMLAAGQIETDADIGSPRAIRIPGYQLCKIKEVKEYTYYGQPLYVKEG
jgi:repressor LexA